MPPQRRRVVAAALVAVVVCASTAAAAAVGRALGDGTTRAGNHAPLDDNHPTSRTVGLVP